MIYASKAGLLISRAESYQVDILARMVAMSDARVPKSIQVEVKTFPSVK